jgi:hypothetical protein
MNNYFMDILDDVLHTYLINDLASIVKKYLDLMEIQRDYMNYITYQFWSSVYMNHLKGKLKVSSFEDTYDNLLIEYLDLKYHRSFRVIELHKDHIKFMAELDQGDTEEYLEEITDTLKAIFGVEFQWDCFGDCQKWRCEVGINERFYTKKMYASFETIDHEESEESELSEESDNSD